MTQTFWETVSGVVEVFTYTLACMKPEGEKMPKIFNCSGRAQRKANHGQMKLEVY